jgi:hypothetical protein
MVGFGILIVVVLLIIERRLGMTEEQVDDAAAVN